MQFNKAYSRELIQQNKFFDIEKWKIMNFWSFW